MNAPGARGRAQDVDADRSGPEPGTILLASLVVIALMAGLLVVAAQLDDSAPTPPAPTATAVPETTEPTTTEPTTTSTASTSTTAPATTSTTAEGPSGDAGLGDTVELADGALARVNGIGISPTDSSRLRAEVEMCAGSAPFEVNALAWAGELPDDVGRDVPITGHDLVTTTLAPGGCARGWVDLGVDVEESLAAVVLTDDAFAEIARWSTGEVQVSDGPLVPSVIAASTSAGEDVSLVAGGSARLESVETLGVADDDDTRELVEIRVVRCAGSEPLVVDPLLWLSTSVDHYTASGEPGLGTLDSRELDAGSCAEGTVIVRALAGTAPASVQLLDDEFVEVARFSVDR